jgi:hypothetical protein
VVSNAAADAMTPAGAGRDCFVSGGFILTGTVARADNQGMAFRHRILASSQTLTGESRLNQGTPLVHCEVRIV